MRKHCPCCGYPAQTCLCAAVKPVNNRIEVIILQHPKESVHAKNTVRLLNLALANITIQVGKTAADFARLAENLARSPVETAVFYPAEQSVELHSRPGNDAPPIERAIFIDASWKQAFGIWQKNSWLNQYPFYKLPLNQPGRYTIRQSDLDFSFSTLEAVAYSLEYLEQLEPTPLLNLLNAFTQQWSRFLPQQD